MSGDGGQPLSFRGHHCSDCGVPISPYSRGRCRKCGYAALIRPVPDDFLIVLRKLGSQAAARYYRTSLATLTRWRRESDLPLHARAKRNGIGQSRHRGFTERPLISLNRDYTMAGQAADFLRRYGAVYRCNTAGKPDAKGKMWKRNFAVLSDEELIHRATRLGFKPFEV